jgi:hypothetical protein
MTRQEEDLKLIPMLETVVSMQACLISNSEISWFAAEEMAKAIEVMKKHLLEATEGSTILTAIHLRDKIKAQAWLLANESELNQFGLLDEAIRQVEQVPPVKAYAPY